ncbi:MAG: PPOX class F420-dependent oxidoreductase [Actinobacteria bacterium]|nr:PPOX class F420-dependent oxidoreductase [Actinomycetota bacterium]
MAGERADIEMTPDEVDAFLRAGRTASFVTLGPDGFPDPVGMWFVVIDGDVWMRTYAKSQKVINLQRDPRAAMLIETGDTYAELRGVQLTGTVEVSDDIERICEVFAGLMVKYEGMDPAHVPAVIEGYRPRAPKQRALRLVVERATSWDHAKQQAVRGP